jgi:predicted DNA-binding transcriptional regulator YafY
LVTAPIAPPSLSSEKPLGSSVHYQERCCQLRAEGRRLVSRRANRGQPRTYRVSNILDLWVTEEHFDRPKYFDLVRFWTTASRAYEVGLYRGKAVLRVSPRGMRRLDLFGSAVVQAAAETVGLPDPDRWIRVVIPIETIDQAAADLMRLGTDAEVIDPPELRHRIAAMAREIAGLYHPSGHSGARALLANPEPMNTGPRKN